MNDILNLGLVAHTQHAEPKDYSRIAIVVPNATDRERLQRELDPQVERFRVISSNQEVAGMRFSAVLITESAQRVAHSKGRVSRDRFAAWLDGPLARHCLNGPVVAIG